jgi:hypothetical protein
MNAMAHDIPLMIGVKQGDVERQIRTLLPEYMAMGETGMHEHATMHHHDIPENTLPMMAGDGPFGPIAMGGMFTLLKVRDTLEATADAGWYTNPPGTVAESIRTAAGAPEPSSYTCPMHPEIHQARPGSCPKCGMKLRPEMPEIRY